MTRPCSFFVPTGEPSGYVAVRENETLADTAMRDFVGVLVERTNGNTRELREFFDVHVPWREDDVSQCVVCLYESHHIDRRLLCQLVDFVVCHKTLSDSLGRRSGIMPLSF